MIDNNTTKQRKAYHPIIALIMGSILAIASLTAAQHIQAAPASADEAAWLQHLKAAHIKHGFNQNGHMHTNLVNAGWQTVAGATEDILILTNQDLRYLRAAAGKTKQIFLKENDLHYQAEIGDELVQLKFFYHF